MRFLNRISLFAIGLCLATFTYGSEILKDTTAQFSTENIIEVENTVKNDSTEIVNRNDRTNSIHPYLGCKFTTSMTSSYVSQTTYGYNLEAGFKYLRRHTTSIVFDWSKSISHRFASLVGGGLEYSYAIVDKPQIQLKTGSGIGYWNYQMMLFAHEYSNIYTDRIKEGNSFIKPFFQILGVTVLIEKQPSYFLAIVLVIIAIASFLSKSALNISELKYSNGIFTAKKWFGQELIFTKDDIIKVILENLSQPPRAYVNIRNGKKIIIHAPRWLWNSNEDLKSVLFKKIDEIHNTKHNA